VNPQIHARGLVIQGRVIQVVETLRLMDFTTLDGFIILEAVVLVDVAMDTDMYSGMVRIHDIQTDS